MQPASTTGRNVSASLHIRWLTVTGETMSTKRIRVFLVLFIFLLVDADVSAHDPGLSAAELQLSNGSLTVELSFASVDIETLTAIDTDHNQEISAAEFLAAKGSLEQLARGAMAIYVDGHS